MGKALVVFGIGVVLALLAVGGYLASQTFFASADPDLEPQNVVVTRVSPTAGEVTFSTLKPVTASIECSTTIDGPFEICGSESVSTTNHALKTSIILDPEQQYYFYILIGNTRYDNLGSPLVFEQDEGAVVDPTDFPSQLFGSCINDVEYVPEYDINDDGCIRLNDRDLFVNQGQ